MQALQLAYFPPYKTVDGEPLKKREHLSDDFTKLDIGSQHLSPDEKDKERLQPGKTLDPTLQYPILNPAKALNSGEKEAETS